MQLLICGLVPLCLGALLPILNIKNRKLRMIYVFISTLITSVYAGHLLLSEQVYSLELFRVTDQLVCRLQLDGAGKIYLGLAALLWPLAALYAAEYMRHEHREGNFFAWYTMTYGVVILLSAAGNLFTLYIFYELLTLITLPLVWHEKDKASIRAARRYALSLIGGAALGLIALLGLAVLGAGEFSLGGTAIENGGQWVLWLCLMGFIGFGAKAAVLPLCKWLPGASVAPTPVTALLHAVAVVNAGVFAVLRLLYYTVSPELLQGTWVQGVMLSLSILTILFGSVMAVREQHLKRRLAWSTVSNLSYMLFGLSLLSSQGMTAGMAHMVFHGLMKIILFYCAGAILVQTGRTQVRQMHGMGRKMPLTFAAYLLAGASLVGVPPLPGFVSKNYLETAAFTQGGFLPIAGAVALLISSVLTAIYIFTVAFPAFFMKLNPHEGEGVFQDPGVCMKITFAVLCLLLIAAGIGAGPVIEHLSGIAGGIL
ncbi:MAG: proton-conducting membrane transporter [Clostridiales bacterium]|nr:proton-conducting membrane transporter [Clostridiales bacterium]